MKITDLGSFYNVRVSGKEVSAFNSTYPCSPIPEKSITFQFQKNNDDLVDIFPDSSSFDGDALNALCQDAKEFGIKELTK